jgi:hypothetical protein
MGKKYKEKADVTDLQVAIAFGCLGFVQEIFAKKF